ncbi:MAG: barnase inhibitor [Archangium gephyra]|uniref:Barnase inhibitor n=1 Tax=Archangium gephyra TaxID=48 RepID=A0A2W5UJ87_9BACT|nr:MAG: barnase inhibitor [Archangium gephyra]
MSSAPRIIDGSRFDGLEGFWDEVTRALFDGQRWGRNLDAFADLLEPGRPVRWLHGSRSREQLGHEETARWLEERLAKVHPSNRKTFELRLAAARRGEGQTLFDTLTDVMRERGVQLDLSE